MTKAGKAKFDLIAQMAVLSIEGEIKILQELKVQSDNAFHEAKFDSDDELQFATLSNTFLYAIENLQKTLEVLK